MRKIALLLLMVTGSSLPGMASRKVTIEQLEQTLARTDAKSDAEVARQLSELELSERLSRERLTQLKAGLPGEKARQALVVLADESAFLEPPQSEIPATATPDAVAQKRMMALTVNYLGKSLPMLPNLFATRETTRFESRGGIVAGAEPAENTLRGVGHSAVTVLYRDRQEFMDRTAAKGDKAKSPDVGLTTWGEFGPILGTVVIDAARSKLTWSHWELGTAGPQAVFHYEVPKEKSHYDVRFCCVSASYGMEVNEVRERTGYHGEITLDPDNGAILRLTVEAEMDAGNPISHAQMAVEYAPIEIGGKTYVCPVRGIALAQAPDAKTMRSILYPPGSDKGLPPLQSPTLQKVSVTTPERGTQQTMLNDVTFRQYHLFRSESRLVADGEKGGTAGAGAGAGTADAALAAGDFQPAAEVATAMPAPAAAGSGVAASPAAATGTGTAAGAVETAVAGPAGEPVIPEISLAEATGLPDSPAIAKVAAPDGSGFTLRISSRLVDVNVVALDKKGRPITNLQPEDFEIYDNGKKEDLRSFEQATGAPAAEAAAVPAGQAAAAEAPAFSNRHVNTTKPGANEGNTIVLLVDGSNLSFVDFADSRNEMERFLRTMPGNERVALYAMKYHGFQVLDEGTTDHEALAKKLAKWMPTAQDMSNANDQEQRNRQVIETVHSPEDMMSVNGNTTLDQESQAEALDAKLRTLGSDPVHIALELMVDIARHLASQPGHKSLVWVTSDNVLADWNKASVTIERGSKFIEPFALRAQEAMNNAHVSVYPLDASHLEANVITAEVGRRNVELTPTFQAPPAVEAAREGAEISAGADLNVYGQSTDMRPGRLTAQMQQDLHSIQGVFREVAEATGGQAFRRSGNIIGELNGVAADGRATYLLSFAPSLAADGKYHVLTVKVVGHKDVTLRYRTGYQYDRDPSTLKERFAKAVWQPVDVGDISITATPSAMESPMVKLGISASDLAMAQTGELWTDKVDVFLVRRDDSGLHAQVTGQTMNLKLKAETYQKMLREGIPFNQIVEKKKAMGAVRIVVVDENSGRIGSITLPDSVLLAKE